MKKLLLVLFVASIGLTACKKDYTCCIDIFGIESCSTVEKASKSDIDELEDAGWDCEKK